jgi:hypothetical protein
MQKKDGEPERVGNTTHEMTNGGTNLDIEHGTQDLGNYLTGNRGFAE